jgi:hypothetical protein
VRFSSSLLFSRLGSGLGVLDSTEGVSMRMATGVERTRTVINTVDQDLVDSSLPVFDEMPARTQNSNFSNLPPWVLIILDKVPRHIFVLEKEGVLQKFIFQI